MEDTMGMNQYVVKSLELHLFFDRIMKEHAFFLEAGFAPAGASYSEKAKQFKKGFENLLNEAVSLSGGVVREAVLESGEILTDFTALAERQTENLTGIPISSAITARTLRLKGMDRKPNVSCQLQGKVRVLNKTAQRLLEGLIGLKEMILKCVLQGELYTVNYPLLIEHILREAKLYQKYLQTLEQEGDLPERMVKNKECFWNQIMMEHAQFIRGLLDPCETEQFCKADGFAKTYCELLETSRNTHDQILAEASLEQTLKFRDFKTAAVQGIQQSRIRSIILPLLADHVLREANHYIRLLR